MGLIDRAVKIAAKNREERFYQKGSGPLMALSIGDDFERLPEKWNVAGHTWQNVCCAPAATLDVAHFLFTELPHIGSCSHKSTVVFVAVQPRRYAHTTLQLPRTERAKACILHWSKNRYDPVAKKKKPIESLADEVVVKMSGVETASTDNKAAGKSPVKKEPVEMTKKDRQKDPKKDPQKDTKKDPKKDQNAKSGISGALSDSTKTDGKVHIIYAGDSNSVTGTIMSIRSMLRHAQDPDKIAIHYISDKPLVGFPDVEFIDIDAVNKEYNIEEFSSRHLNVKRHGNLNALGNYARFVLPQIFPKLDKVLWIDGDTIVKCDVTGMVRSALTKSNHPIAAVERPRKDDTIYWHKVKSKADKMTTSWNAGLFVADLIR